jgi:haloalkane dehalogenase
MGVTDPIGSDFPYEGHFADVFGSRMHYANTGTGRPVLFLHGNPTSSYLWRNVIPHFEGQSRCVAPDLIGMSRSVWPDLDYSCFDHARYLDGFIAALGLTDLTLVVHDWGSALGLHYARRHPENVRAVCLMEFIRPLSWDDFPEPVNGLFRAFRTPDVGYDLIVNQNVFVEQVLFGSIGRGLSEPEKARFREPFIEPGRRKPLWRWPNQLPIEGEPADVCREVEAYHAWLLASPVPKRLLHAAPGWSVTPEKAAWYASRLPKCRAVDVGPGVHYIQEDYPTLIGRELSEWLTKHV